MKYLILKLIPLILAISMTTCVQPRPKLPTFNKIGPGTLEKNPVGSPIGGDPDSSTTGTLGEKPISGDSNPDSVPPVMTGTIEPGPAVIPSAGTMGNAGTGNTGLPPTVPDAPPSVILPKLSLLFIGGGSAKIDVYKLDRATGTTTLLKSNATPGSNPTFLAIDKKNKRVFAANELADGGLLSFSLDTETGALNPLSSAAITGGAVHVSFDLNAKVLFGVSYVSGHVASFPIDSDGKLGPAITDILVGLKAHEVVPTSTSLYVPCFNCNTVQIYTLAADGSFIANGKLALGGGPRHITMHPNGKWAYIITEAKQTVQALKFNGTKFEFNAFPVSALITPTPGTGAEVQVHPNGKFLYASLRGADVIATYSVQADGTIVLLENVKTGGTTPRHFSIDPLGNFIVVANQDGGGITLLKIDPTTGKLTKADTVIPFESPQFVEVVDFD